MKRCSTSLIIVEIQVRTTMWYHLTPVRITILKKFTNNKHWTGYGEKGSLLHNWASQVGQWVKDIPAMQEMQVRSLSQKDLLEEMATHSTTLAWKIPRTEGAWGLQLVSQSQTGPSISTSIYDHWKNHSLD